MNNGSGGSVACVGDYLDAAIEVELRRDFIHIGSGRVHHSHLARAMLEVLFLDEVQDILDGFAVQCAGTAHGLEAVVFRRIVTAGDHDGAVGFGVLRRIVKHWSGNDTDIGDIRTRLQQPFHQRVAEPGRAKPAIAADVDLAATTATLKISAQPPSQQFDIRAQEFRIGNAPDVVLAEDGRLEHITTILAGRRARLTTARRMASCPTTEDSLRIAGRFEVVGVKDAKLWVVWARYAKDQGNLKSGALEIRNADRMLSHPKVY